MPSSEHLYTGERTTQKQSLWPHLLDGQRYKNEINKIGNVQSSTDVYTVSYSYIQNDQNVLVFKMCPKVLTGSVDWHLHVLAKYIMIKHTFFGHYTAQTLLPAHGVKNKAILLLLPHGN